MATRNSAWLLMPWCLGGGIWLFGLQHQETNQATRESVQLVMEGDVGEPGGFGVEELTAALKSRGAVVQRGRGLDGIPEGALLLAGIRDRSPLVAELERSGQIAVPPRPESYTVARTSLNERPVLVAAAADERGLMYALLELARRVLHFEDGIPVSTVLSGLPAETKSPAVPLRGMVQFLHSADLEKNWYHDPEYWQEYLGMLARDRFNSLNLVFAHQTSYLAPPYPFLFTLENYPQVRVPGLSRSDQEKNLSTLRMISRAARRRGIDFVMGIWEHRAWQRGQRSMVEGLTDDILADYARLAMKQLLTLCPDITGIQLRVNAESGIDMGQQTEFYREGVLAGMQAAGRPVLLDLRGWGALPGTIDAAANSGLPMRLSMKYWAEFMGMPYQAAEMLPSYSFADFLRYPRRFRVLHQVWSLGSHRLLPWGSVDWMKRFVPTTLLGDAVGFETCAPLSQKGFGNPPGDWRIFVSPEREYYRWEFQRYWLYYLLYGRLSYDPEAAEDVWMDEFRARFGKDGAAPVFAAFQSASEVIPFLVSYRLSNPNMYIWPEKQMGGLLDFYIEVKPADVARIAGFDEYSAWRLLGIPLAKMKPEEASRRLNAMAQHTESALEQADAAVRDAGNREYAANRTDLTVLALLARYHARKILAGACLDLFYRTGDASQLSAAEGQAAAALEIWERLVRLTDGIYFDKMVFGPRDTGHWKDNLVFVRHDVARLQEVRLLLDRYGLFDLGLDFGARVAPVRSAYQPQYGNFYPVERRFSLLDPETAYTPQRGYGWLDTAEIASSAPMRIPYSSLEGDNLEGLALPSGVLYGDFLRGRRESTLRVDLPDGEYRVTAIVANGPELASGAFRIRAAGPAAESATISYALAETGDKSTNVSVAGGRLLLEFIPEPGGDWLVSGLTITRRAPHIAHVPIRNVVPGARTILAATITAPDPVLRVSAQIMVEGEDEPLIVYLQGEQRYSAETDWPARWNGKAARYSFTAVDNRGNASRWPAGDPQVLYIRHDSEPPAIAHEPVRRCEPDRPLRLQFEISDASGLAVARLRYRHLTQSEKYQALDLRESGNKYEAVIPAGYIGKSYDLMYYVEAVDSFGNGAFYPDPDRTAPYIVVTVRR